MKRILVVILLITGFLSTGNLSSQADDFSDSFGNQADYITNENSVRIKAPALFEPCLTVITKQCIESISAEDENGKIYKATPLSTKSYQWESGILKQIPDWSLEGIKFQYETNIFGISVSQIPNGVEICSKDRTQCSGRNIGKIQMFIYPHFSSPKKPTLINFIDETNQKQCGTLVKPDFCYGPPLFGVNLKWTVKLVVNPFVQGVIWGRSTGPEFDVLTKNFKKSNFDLIQISGTNLKYEDFVVSELRNTPILSRSKSDYVRDYLWIEVNDNLSSYAKYVAGKCMDLLNGNQSVKMVSNAWQMNAPVWNADERILSVALFSPSKSFDGTLTKGYLEIAIPFDLVRCLWGVDSRYSAKASVQVTYPNSSEKQIVTFSQFNKNNSLYLVGNNFHYSNPTFGVKILEDSNPSFAESSQLDKLENLLTNRINLLIKKYPKDKSRLLRIRQLLVKTKIVDDKSSTKSSVDKRQINLELVLASIVRYEKSKDKGTYYCISSSNIQFRSGKKVVCPPGYNVEL